MTDKTIRLQLEAAFDQALRHAYDYWFAERKCELEDRAYKSWDGRGYHSVSLEAGRLFALVELCPDLSEKLDLHALRKSAREDAAAVWREKTFESYLSQPEDEGAQAA